MAIYFIHLQDDGDVGNLANYYESDDSTPATSLPGPGDTVAPSASISGGITSGTSSANWEMYGVSVSGVRFDGVGTMLYFEDCEITAITVDDAADVTIINGSVTYSDITATSMVFDVVSDVRGNILSALLSVVANNSELTGNTFHAPVKTLNVIIFGGNTFLGAATTLGVGEFYLHVADSLGNPSHFHGNVTWSSHEILVEDGANPHFHGPTSAITSDGSVVVGNIHLVDGATLTSGPGQYYSGMTVDADSHWILSGATLGGSESAFPIAGRLTISPGVTLYAPTASAVAPASAVLAGVTNLGVMGTYQPPASSGDDMREDFSSDGAFECTGGLDSLPMGKAADGELAGDTSETIVPSKVVTGATFRFSADAGNAGIISVRVLGAETIASAPSPLNLDTGGWIIRLEPGQSATVRPDVRRPLRSLSVKVQADVAGDQISAEASL